MVQCIEAPAATAIDGKRPEQSNCNLTTLDLDILNQRFDQASPQEILAWCLENIPQGLVQTTSFSLLPVTHMLYKELNHPVPVIFLDTLHLFPETLETAQKAKTLYDLDLHVYRAVGVDSQEAFAARYGETLWERDIDRFYELTKVEPLQRSLNELNVKAWITGRRRDQSKTRQNLPIFERDENGRLKVNPLANWTSKDVWTYTFNHNVPYNPLHDQGYTSIGDQPLTTPTAANEDERAGRWRDSEKTECGIHL
ncbi:MAG: phosphoadenosine phosphosulfate reductase [Leptolyngbya foveolarum]|uniref:Phosphoadenosine 5'-phosphosulfate reductase n=1 Tax=Leptolyngbya foveolarum TaxID=47253 RepID=A0A2W4U6Q5_9CYAN|nr:MAG: phosphoadenosine phosphosulfate reductase [Leptolyngbya foveolarum]